MLAAEQARDMESNTSTIMSVKRKRKRKRKPKMVKVQNISPAEENILAKIPEGLAGLISSMKAPESAEVLEHQPSKILSRNDVQQRRLFIPTDEVRNNSDDEDIASLIAESIAVGEADADDDSMKDFLYRPEEVENSDNDNMELLPQPKVKTKGKKNKSRESHEYEIDSKGRRIFRYKDHLRSLGADINCVDTASVVESEVPLIEICTLGVGTESKPEGKRPVESLGKYVNQVLQIDESQHPEELDPDDVVHVEEAEYPYDLSEENKDVGKHGDILVPEHISQEDFECKWSKWISMPRPYVKVNIFGVHEQSCLLDSGAAVNCINQTVMNLVKSRLAEEGLYVSVLPSDVGIKCFGGRLIDNNEVAILSLTVADKVVVEGQPFLVVNEVGVNQGVLLGAPFLDATHSAIEYHLDGKVILKMGEVDPTEIEAEMVGNVHKIEAVESVTVTPKRPQKLKAHFVMAHGMGTSLDDVPMILQSSELEDLLGEDQSQVLRPDMGEMTLTLHNRTDQPIHVMKGFPLGEVITAEAMTEAIDLAVMRKYVDTVEMSETRLVNCLCPETIGTDVGVMMALDDDDYSCLGTNMERASPFETDNRLHKTDRLSWMGNKLFVRTNNYKPGRQLSPDDMDSIQKVFKKKMYKKILVPYKNGRTVNLILVNSIQEIRNNGYKVSICAFCPTVPMKTGKDGEEETCEKCINGSLSGLINDAEKYKITNVNVAFPTMAKHAPEGFNVKLQGTNVAVFKFWMWTATYFLQDINSVGILVHMPLTYSNKEHQIKNHCLLLFKYLKMAFPKALMSMVALTTENANLLWLKPVTEAFEEAKVFRDYYDASLGKPRKRKSKIDSVPFDIAKEQCSCHFCDPQKPDIKKYKTFTIVRANWGMDPYWEKKIKEYEKELRKSRPVIPRVKRKPPKSSSQDLNPSLHESLDLQNERSNQDPMSEARSGLNLGSGESEDGHLEGGVNEINAQARGQHTVQLGLIDAVEIYGKDLSRSPCIDEVEMIDSMVQMLKSRNHDSCDDPEYVESVEICKASTYEVFGVHFHCEGTGDCAEKRQQQIVLGREPTVPDKIQGGYDPANDFEAKAPIEDISEWVNMDHLLPAQRRLAIELLDKHHNVLSISSDDRRYIRNHYLSFEVSDHSPWYIKPYPMSAVMAQEYMRHFEALVTRGHCARDVGQRIPKILMFSPSFLVWKNSASRNAKDWTQTRLVSDFGRLNKLITTSDHGHSIPTVDEIINATSGSRCLSVSDAANYFPSFRIDTQTQRFCGLSAVGNNHSLYSLVASLGVSVYPGLTQLSARCMLRKSLKSRVLMYIDDLIICSVGERYPILDEYKNLVDSEPGLNLDYLEHLSILHDFLCDADHFGLLLSAAKFKICTPSFEYLGIVLNEGGRITIPKSKIKILEEFPVDSDKLTPTDLMGFIGLINYLSAAIDSFSAKVYLLTKKATERAEPGKKWRLDSIHKQLIRELINDARDAPCRYVLNSALPIHFFVDSSLFSMSAICFNFDPESGRWLFIRAYSWRHSEHNLRVLPAILKEMCTIVKLLRVVPSLFQNPVQKTTIWTDQQVLVALMINNQLETPNPKLTRWLMAISNFPLQFQLRYSPNTTKLLKCADFGSRHPMYNVRYVSRFSNKLKNVPDHLRPKWNSEVTDEDIRKYIQKCDYIKYPKTTKIRVPVQDQEGNEDEWQDEDAYEKLALEYFLPKLQWSALGPPQPDKVVPKRPHSVVTQDSALSEILSADSEAGEVGEDAAAQGCADDSPNQTVCEPLTIWSELHEINVTLGTSLENVTEETFGGSAREKWGRVKEIAVAAAPLILNTPHMIRQFKQNVEKMENVPVTFEQITAGQAADPKYSKIISQLLSGKAPKQVRSKYILFEGSLLMRKGKDGVHRICLDFKTTLLMAAWVHLWAHAGENSTNAALGTYCCSSYLRSAVKGVIESCLVCKFSKPKLTKKDCLAGVMRRPMAAWEQLAIDYTHMPDDEYPYMFVAVDTATRFVFTKPTKNQGQKVTAEILWDLFSWCPGITSLHSDNALGLVKSRMVRDVCRRFGVTTLTRLPALPTGGSIVERAISSLKQIYRVVNKKYKAKRYLEIRPYVTRILNFNFRRYYTILDGKIKAVWTSPMQLSYPSVDSRLKLRDMLGDRNLTLTLEEQRSWKRQFQEAINAYNVDRNEMQRRLDEAYEPKVVKGDIVLLLETREKEKKLRTYKINLYKVMSRENRRALIKPLFGPPEARAKTFKVYAGFLTKFSQSELVKHLPPAMQKALGCNIPLKGGRDLPEQFWEYSHTQRGQDEAYYNKKLKGKKRKGQPSLSTSSSGSSSGSGPPSSDEDLPYGLGNKNRHWTLPGGPLDDAYYPETLGPKPEPELPEEDDSVAPKVVQKKDKRRKPEEPSDTETVKTEDVGKRSKKGKKWYQKIFGRGKKRKGKAKKKDGQ